MCLSQILCSEADSGAVASINSLILLVLNRVSSAVDHTLTRPAQSADPTDRGALAATLEPLQGVARAHRGGPEEYARRVALELLEAFLAVEEQFQTAGSATEQEVIDALRQVGATTDTRHTALYIEPLTLGPPAQRLLQGPHKDCAASAGSQDQMTRLRHRHTCYCLFCCCIQWQWDSHCEISITVVRKMLSPHQLQDFALIVLSDSRLHTPKLLTGRGSLRSGCASLNC